MQEHFKTTKISNKEIVSYLVSMKPITTESQEYHYNEAKKAEKDSKSIQYSLANIQGLITRKRNKCKYVEEVTDRGMKHKVIALTETWTKDKYQGEILEHFKDYNVMMTDREYDPKLEDPHQLKTRGGTMILTSPDIPISPQISKSNGNCEVAIARLHTINALVISMYRPSGKNFNLDKFVEALSWIRKYFRDNADELKDTHISLMGDFNFPKNIVEWKDSQHGLIADYSPGISIQKRAFEHLLELTEEYQLEQVVNQPTRGKNILDLIFTNRPDQFSNCSSAVLKPLSDHRLVNFVVANPAVIKGDDTYLENHVAPEFSSFNFRSGNE